MERNDERERERERGHKIESEGGRERDGDGEGSKVEGFFLFVLSGFFILIFLLNFYVSFKAF